MSAGKVPVPVLSAESEQILSAEGDVLCVLYDDSFVCMLRFLPPAI